MHLLQRLLIVAVLPLLLAALTACDPVNPIYFVNHTGDTLFLRTTPDTLGRVYVQIPHSRRDTSVTPLKIVIPPGDTSLYGYVLGDWYEPEVFEHLDIRNSKGIHATIEGQSAVFAKITSESYGSGLQYYVNIP